MKSNANILSPPPSPNMSRNRNPSVSVSQGLPRDLILDDGREWTLPIPNVFGLEIFQMVLKDPLAAAGLLKFSRETGYSVDMAYLSKVSDTPSVAMCLIDRIS